MKRALLGGCCAALLLATVSSNVACQGGVSSEAGNAFPCDFAAPPAERDSACTAGWVCGVDDRCRIFNRDEIYFGEYNPRTQLPPLPPLDFTRSEQLYPLLPTAPIAFVTPEVSGDLSLNVLDVVYEGSRTVHRVDFGARTLGTGAPIPSQVADPIASLSFLMQGDGGTARAWLDGDGGTVFVELALSVPMPFQLAKRVQSGGTDLTNAVELQYLVPVKNGNGEGGIDQLGMIIVALPGGDPATALGYPPAARVAGELVMRPSMGQPPFELRFAPFDLPVPDGGPLVVRDARVTSFRNRRTPIVLADQGIFLRCEGRSTPGGSVDGGAASICEPGPLGDETWLRVATEGFEVRARELGVSADRTVWAVLADSRKEGRPRALLHTFGVKESPSGLEVTRALPICEPCRRGRAIRVTPSSEKGVRADVLCTFTEDGGVRHTVERVIGLAAGGSCEVDAFIPAIDPTSVSSVALPTNGLVVLGGTRGQLWMGETLSEAQPRFLDRAPGTVTRLGTGPDALLMALTDQYVAIEQRGFGMVPLVQPRAERPVAVVGNSEGLFVLPSADLVRVQPRFTDGGIEADVSFGPRLAAPAGGSAPGPFLAYRVDRAEPDVPAHLIATANDSLYFAEGFTNESPANSTPDPANALVSVLTPEPNFPIRSLAVADNAAGTDLSQGYVVTSRNLFDFRLDAQRRWNLQQIQMPAGEPVEVAMQTPQRPYGRVMYRDGTVFTLPSGFLLAPAMETDGGSVRVSDLEHVYGRPFAVTGDCVYVADPGGATLAEGSQERYVVWQWRPVAHPGDGGFIRGTLHTLREPRDVAEDNAAVYLFDENGAVLRLVDIPIPGAK